MTVKNLLPFLVGQVLVIGLLLMGVVLYNTVKQNAFLEVQTLTAEAHLADLKMHHDEMDKATAALAATTKSIEGVKAEIRRTVRKAMKDEAYKIWHESRVPPVGVGVLREAASNYGVRVQEPAGGDNNEPPAGSVSP